MDFTQKYVNAPVMASTGPQAHKNSNSKKKTPSNKNSAYELDIDDSKSVIPIDSSQTVSSHRKNSKGNEVYDYFLHDYAKSKQKIEPHTEADWHEMVESRNAFMRVSQIDKTYV